MGSYEASTPEEQIEASAQSNNISTFFLALLFNFILAIIYLSLFCLLRVKFPKIYGPKVLALPENARVKVLPNGLFNWLFPLLKTKHSDVLMHYGVDAYTLIRFLYVCILYFGLLSVIVPTVLIPLNALNQNGLEGFDGVSVSNIKDSDRLWGHAFMILVISVITLWLVFNELKKLSKLRHNYYIMMAKKTPKRIKSILATNIPPELRDLNKLNQIFDGYPGGVAKIAPCRNSKMLEASIRKRNRLIKELEIYLVKVILVYGKLKGVYGKESRTDSNITDKPLDSPGNEIFGLSSLDRSNSSTIGTPSRSNTFNYDEKHRSNSFGNVKILKSDSFKSFSVRYNYRSRYLKEPKASKLATLSTFKAMPRNLKNLTHVGVPRSVGQPSELTPTDSRLEPKFFSACILDENSTSTKTEVQLPAVFSKIAHKIEQLRCDIKKMNQDIEIHQNDTASLPLNAAVFVTFNEHLGCQLAAQTVIHNKPIQLNLQAHPNDVIWSNIYLGWFELTVRKVVFVAFVAVLTIFWAVPVTFVASIASLEALAALLPFLNFILDFPSLLIGFIQGALPSLFLNLLTHFLEVILILTAKWQGDATFTQIQLGVLTKYFVFLLINVLFVVTFAGGIIQSIGPLINNPTSIINILATSLPKVSNFFITYVLFQALVELPSQLATPFSIIIYRFLQSTWFYLTPRGFLYKTVSPEPKWAFLWPSHLLILVITLTYAAVAPVILYFSLLYFSVGYCVNLYFICYVNATPSSSDSGGKYYVKALNMVCVGLYIAQVTMVGILLLNKAIGPAVIVVITLVTTAVCHHFSKWRFVPSIDYFPVSDMDGLVDSEHLVESGTVDTSPSKSYSTPSVINDLENEAVYDPDTDPSDQVVLTNDELTQIVKSVNPPIQTSRLVQGDVTSYENFKNKYQHTATDTDNLMVPVWLPEFRSINFDPNLIRFIEHEFHQLAQAEIQVVVDPSACLDIDSKELVVDLN